MDFVPYTLSHVFCSSPTQCCISEPARERAAMLTKAANGKLTQGDAGARMGALRRKYWRPALLSWELERDGALILVKMLGDFFFSSRRRHTRFDCDWSSDVCSSD